VTRAPSSPREPQDVRVDIVVDNFNYAAFVEEALRSALAQTHPNVRVIVVDDGSTDRSREILSTYTDRVAVVLKGNGGQASALNAGLVHCEGDVVIFLDADDVLERETAARVAAIFARGNGTVQVPYRLAVIDAHGRRNGHVKPPPDMELPAGEIAAAKLAFPFDVVSVGTSGNAFSLPALRQITPIPEADFAACADWYLVHVMPLLGRVTPLDEIGGYYRVHGKNAYEPQEVRVDLRHVRQTVRYAAVTRGALEQVADGRGLRLPYGEILSVSDIANRLISLRLDRERHPETGDTVPQLLRDGIRAATRRWDSPAAMKAVFILWFLLVAVAPRPLLNPLAVAFLFRERRVGLNKLIYKLRNRHLRLDVKLDRQA
jgi:glycosyltransferase involved in cell wall biosynthesis